MSRAGLSVRHRESELFNLKDYEVDPFVTGTRRMRRRAPVD